MKGLSGMHLWTEQTLWEQFIYDDRKSISLAFVRVRRLHHALVQADSPKFGGCKSWVNLGEVDVKVLSLPPATLFLGQELSVKPFSLLSTNPRITRARWF